MMRNALRQFCYRRFGSLRGQFLLERIVSHLDSWRGYGTGAFVANSGEKVLFTLLDASRSVDAESVILDVGANFGDFSAQAFSSLDASIQVHAFEPQTQVFEQLKHRFKDNPRIILNNFALGRSPCEMPIFVTAADPGMASLLQRDLTHTGVTTSMGELVRLERLDDYCERHGIRCIDLLKMDAEGFEFEILSGAEKLFGEGRIRHCSFEFGGCNLDSRTFFKDFYQFFERHGMQVYRITPAETLVPLRRYSESLERFTNTNYVAVRKASIASSC
jgi:FkbM family methyltransferase